MALYKRPETDLWYYEFRLDGVRYRGSTKTANKREATEYEARIYREAKEDASKARLGMKRMTVYELAQSWLKASISLLDAKGNHSRVRKLFGDELQQQGNEWVLVEKARYGLPRTLMVHELTQGMLMDLRSERMAEGNSSGTINRELSLLQSLLGYAETLGCVMPERSITFAAKKNRAASLKMPEREGKLRYLSLQQEQHLLAILRETADQRSNDQGALDNLHLVTVLLDTGARYSEVAKITWDMVELDAGFINLYRTKVGNESRLRLTDRTWTLLKARRASITFPCAYVFPALRGRAWAGTNKPRGHATAAIQNAIDKTGCNENPNQDRLTPHGFRDTFASRLVQAGLSLLKVSKLLGHADISMTEKYAHLDMGRAGDEAVAILNLMAANKPTQGDDPMAQRPEANKPTQGDDPIGTSTPHSFPHTEVTHSQQLASRYAANDSQVVDAVGKTVEGVVGRA